MDDRTGLRALAELYRGHYPRLAIALLVYLVKSSPAWSMPLVAAHVVDVVAAGDPARTDELWWSAGLLAVLLLQNIPTNWLFVRLVSTAIRDVELQVRQRAAAQVQRLSIDVFGRSESGGLQTKLLRDAEVIEQASRQLLLDVPAVVFTLLIAVAVIALRTPAFLVVVLPAAVISVAVARWSQRPMVALQHDYRTSVEQTSAALTTLLRMAAVAKAHGAEDHELEQVETRLRHHQEVGLRLDISSGWFGASTWVAVQAFATVTLLASGWAALHGRWGIGVGDVVLLSGYFSTFTGGILGLLNQLPVIARGRESAASLHELMTAQDVERFDGLPELDALHGQLRFEDVSLDYGDGRGLDSVSLTVEPGELVAVVGPSGSGKSTLLNVAVGLYRPTSGRLLVDGVDLASLDLRSYRRRLGVVPQEVALFDGTVRDNVLHGAGDVPPERLAEALEVSGVDRLPLTERLDTHVGLSGLRLSGGQRQRIALARALVRDARVLVLDEATSALDAASDRVLQQALQRGLGGRTCVVVTHRMSTARSADRILVLAQGRVAGLGTHEQLLAECPTYVDLLTDEGAVSASATPGGP